MHDPEHNASRLPPSTPPRKEHQCSCGCQPEAVYVAELQRDYAGILPELCSLGEMICFARNRHCILGGLIALPDLRGDGPTFTGTTPRSDFHLDTTQWSHAYTVHERHKSCGTFIGLEFYDANHRALFRTCVSPGSEQRDLQGLVHNFHRRGVPLEEMAAWHRMGRLTPAHTALHAGVTDRFARADLPSTPFDATRVPIKNEAGFDGSLPLANAILADAQEEAQELGVTVSGGFGRMSLAFTPYMLENISESWLYAGEPGYALRLDLSAVNTYWIGSYEADGHHFSYLEAVDAFGGLITRICSANPDSHRYWRSLAASM
ncbi:hypothetical protein H5P28_18070 [Ruficoccus amylovorans]|uniref:Haemin-degrading HemS/ChuX domain-containing protein n=1 Tax=Ruficoccus amylovorans TaxID=1804625 RepID=A0A842HIJ1_9BACT|nr:ChuX/HutX family heme-like substrate-binding protein [Ruficoccus amylovorans]MBC2596179.1 hypothetical protein [Ruficoccus amylovorans]